MTDIELMIGQSSTEAERNGRKAGKQGTFTAPDKRRTFVRHSSTRDRDRVRGKEIEIEKEREGKRGTLPSSYGRYNNVILTDTELSGLKTELPDKWEY